MTRSKKILLIALPVFLAVLTIALWLLTSDGKAPAKGLWLSRRPTEDIGAIGIDDHQKGISVSLLSSDGGWVTEEGNEQIAYDEMAPLLAVLGYMKASYLADDAGENLSEYGLDSPAVTIRVKYRDTAENVYRLGNSLDGQGVYLKKDEDKSVYLIDPLRAQVLCGAAESFLENPLARVSFDRIVGVSIRSPEQGEISLNRSESPRSGGDFFWSMTKPYVCNASTKAVEEIVAMAAGIGGAGNAGEVPEGGYGFDENHPLKCTFYDSFDRALTLTFGRSQGNKVYCRINDGGEIYLIDNAVLDIFSVGPQSLMDPALYYYETASITDCVLRYQGRQYHLQAEWESTGQKDEKAQRFFLNGETISGADYHHIAELITSVRTEPVSLIKPETDELAASVEIRRMSAPYEQTIALRVLPEEPGMVGVDYGGGIIARLDKKALEEIFTALDKLLNKA